MEKSIGKEYPQEERIQFLKDNCDKVEKKTYMRQFSREEIIQKKDELSEASIAISDIEDEKREALKEIKERLDPLMDQKKTLLTNIKQKAEEVKEECFKFIDQEERMVGFYNGEGNLIELRPAYADELQTTIFQINRKTGTDD